MDLDREAEGQGGVEERLGLAAAAGARVSRITRTTTATRSATLGPEKASARQGWPVTSWPRPGKTRAERRSRPPPARLTASLTAA